MTLTQLLDRAKHTLIPTFDQIGELRDKHVFKTDLMAGITVALVLVPQSMAYAQLAGLPAYVGLYASFLPPMIAAIFGSSRQLATGPVAVVSLMTAAALEPLAAGSTTGFVAYAAILALMIGLFQMALGFFRLGVLVDFLSHPVVVGFTNAGAIIIATSQLSKLFGVTAEKAATHFETVWNVLKEVATSTHWPTLFMTIFAILLMVGIKKWRPAWPGVLIAVVATTIISWLSGFAEKDGAIVGVVPQGIPMPTMPEFNMDVMLQLVTSAVVISLIGFMEAISIAKAIAAKTRQRIDANQELIGQGLSNISSGVFGGYPVSGSFSRSAVNNDAGAITGFSSIVTGLVVGLSLLLLTPLLYHLPQATLASIIIMAVIGLVKIEPIIHAWKAEKHDGIVAVVTFLLTLIMAPHLDKGILIGVVLSMGLFIFRTMRPRFAELGRYHDQTLRDRAIHPEMERCEEIVMFRFDMSLYYANAGYFETKVLKLIADNPKMKYLILDAEGINMLDSTGEMVLLQLMERLKSAGVHFLIARMKKQFMDSLRNCGDIKVMGDDHFFARMTYALEYAWAELGCEHCEGGEGCPFKVDAARRHYARHQKEEGFELTIDSKT